MNLLKPNKNKKLLAAAERGNLRAVRRWLKAGANPNCTADKTGRMPLHAASRSNNPDVIKTLLAAGADPDCRDEAGWTPLHCAAYNNRTRSIKALVEGGARLDIRANSGLTPLNLAENKRNKLTQEMLKEAARLSKHGWQRTDEDEIAFTRDVGGRELVDIFNFRAQQRTSLVRNLETGSEHQHREHFRDVAVADLEKAAIELAAHGGTDHRNGACKVKAPLDIGLKRRRP